MVNLYAYLRIGAKKTIFFAKPICKCVILRYNLRSAMSDHLFAYLRIRLSGRRNHRLMPWPMTLAPTNEAIRRDNRVEKLQ
jgi:hypothetical protein